MPEDEEVVKTESVDEEAEGAEVTPTDEVVTETEGTSLTLETVHALVLELQGQVQNLQAIADQATPVEPAAVEVEEDDLDAGLLEEDAGAETAEGTEEDDLDADLLED